MPITQSRVLTLVQAGETLLDNINLTIKLIAQEVKLADFGGQSPSQALVNISKHLNQAIPGEEVSIIKAERIRYELTHNRNLREKTSQQERRRIAGVKPRAKTIDQPYIPERNLAPSYQPLVDRRAPAQFHSNMSGKSDQQIANEIDQEDESGVDWDCLEGAEASPAPGASPNPLLTPPTPAEHAEYLRMEQKFNLDMEKLTETNRILGTSYTMKDVALGKVKLG